MISPVYYYIFNSLTVASDVNFSEYSCLIVVVLSYGEFENIVYGVDSKFSYQQLISPFQSSKTPTLLDTPKFFIIQVRFYTMYSFYILKNRVESVLISYMKFLTYVGFYG